MPRPSRHDTLPLELVSHLNSLCAEFEKEWSAGRQPVVEEYLARAPEPARPTLLRDLLRLECDYRARAARPPEIDEYRRRFGHLGEWVGPLLDELFQPPPGQFRVTLTVTEGPHQGESFTFTEHQTFLVGRSPEAHFCLPEKDPYFSRMHFLVEVNPPLCRLVDLHSRNGTLVNGRRVQDADLSDGDVIQGGRTTLRVALQRPAPAAAGTLSLPGADPHATLTPPPGAQPQAADRSDEPPTVPGYRLLRELGRGGMGVVYEAVREADGGRVALKTILPAVQPTREAVGRFLREAEILRCLQHPHIVPFREMGEAGGLLFFAMDFVPGQDAARILKADGPLPVGRAVGWILPLLDALAYAHAQGFVHRDVKPANLLITPQAGGEAVRLADFGLARTYQASALSGLTMTGRPGGTPAFMPPEQVLDFRRVQPAADQFAAAATLYNLLTAQPLYDDVKSTTDLYLKFLQEEPVPLSKRRGLPDALAAVIHRGLARRPENRYPDVSELRQALAPFAAG